MIPSSPRRTLIFTIVSSFVYFGPDFLVPKAWTTSSSYEFYYACYQSALVIIAFWFSPSICHWLVLRKANLAGTETKLPITIFDHPAPFILTAGMLPRHCEIFLSSGLANRVTPLGIRFLIARAVTHGTALHRLGAFIPALAFAWIFPGIPDSLKDWLNMFVFLALWLIIHWGLELNVDRSAATQLGSESAGALRDVLAVTNPHNRWLTTQPPLAWRLWVVRG